MVVIMKWLNVTIYHFLKWQINGSFLSSITDQIFFGIDYTRVSYAKSNCWPFSSIWVHRQFLVGSMMLIFLVFCFVFVLCLVPNVTHVSRLPFLIAPSIFSNVYSYHPYMSGSFSRAERNSASHDLYCTVIVFVPDLSDCHVHAITEYCWKWC
jgi:hypothetical protein